MAAAAETYEEIAEKLSSKQGVKRAKMFGMPGLKLGKTAFAGLFDTDMVFKLGQDTEEFKKAMKLEGAQVWDPSGRHRPFKDWVRIPSTNASQWSVLADYAFQRALAEQ